MKKRPLVFLPTSLCAAGTTESELDLNELFQDLELSLTWRSKPMRLQTLSRKWKRDYWMRVLCSRISSSFRMSSYVTELPSCQQDFLASHSAPQESDEQPKMSDTCTHTSQMELPLCDHDMSSLKTSKESLVPRPQTENRYLNMSSETWKKEVIAVRGEYSARLKRALHTNGNESSSLGSYPTPAARDYKGTNSEHHVMNKSKGYKGHMNQLPNFIKYGMDNWPTPRAGNPGSRKPGTGGKILAEEAKKNWATPNTMDHLPPKTGEALARNKKKGGCKNLREDVNNPQMNWPTARTSDAEGGAIKTEMTEKGFRSRREKSDQYFGAKLRDAVETHEQNWATPQASDHVEGARTATESNQKCLGRDLARLDGPQDQVSNSTSGSNQGSPKLNPAWVCQIMGLPSGWTNLGCWATE